MSEMKRSNTFCKLLFNHLTAALRRHSNRPQSPPIRAFAAWGYSKKPSSHKSSREVGRREERWEAPNRPQGVLPHNWDGNEPKPTITCMVLKATTNDGRTM
ncbi:hypothetical protein TNCV_2305121 [Trichonephila clavipes]|nr:hypothetical protein TNCV_2305121 [Trichonephila clavipes]